MPDSTSRIDAIADRLWERLLELQPTGMTIYAPGNPAHDSRLDDAGPAGRRAIADALEAAAAECEAVPEAEVGLEDRITRDIIRTIADLTAEAEALGVHHLRAIDHMEGPQALLGQLAVFQPSDTPEGLEAWLTRLAAYGTFIDQNIEVAREGLAVGHTPARIVVEKAIELMAAQVSVPLEQSVLVTMSKVPTEADRERVAAVVRDVVRPADARYLAMLRDEALPVARDLPGLCSATDGDALYRLSIRQWTSLDMAPAEVHQVGLDELAAIDEERRAIARAEGFGDDVAAYRAALAATAANQPASPEALVAVATEDIGRALAVAPTVFGRLPVAGCIVKPVEAYREKVMAFAFYYPPALDGSRPGIYYVNTYDLPSRLYSKLASTTYHEATPGHHFQIALEMEHPQLNSFRRMGARAVAGAYVEGWGLYSERLADELGLYRNPGERLGMLDAQAWRASRLIVDSGMHGLGWTRQQSIDWLLATGLSATDAQIETDRYIAWPGQALTYMLGMREIRRLRRELEARDGDRFDLSAFHDAVLGHGSLPLATLARELPGWVAPRA